MGTSAVRVTVRKFDGSLHWHHTMTLLGEDEHGVWLGAPIGTVYGKGPVTQVYATEERRVMRIRADGSVFVDDEDEFALHKDRYGYPPDVIASAESAAASLTAALRDAREPFGDRYRDWLRR
ncbi:MAG TPA: DUF402 domain-containing protein, partial [Streptomyces sp.]|nr:DUF402 domain-containing protein [Streptomyces sp.]